MSELSDIKAQAKQDRTEFSEVQKRLWNNTKPDPKDVTRYREIMAEYPNIFGKMKGLSEQLREKILGRISDGLSQARLLAEEDAIKCEMHYTRATPMERLLIDQILTAKVHLIYAERVFGEKVAVQCTLADLNYWQNFLASAQRRYIRAIESLARVQRLARNTPLLQVNIANMGMKETSVQGRLFDVSEASCEINGRVGGAAHRVH